MTSSLPQQSINAAPPVPRRRPAARRGFSLTDLTVSLLLLATVGAVAVPVGMGRAREQANRIKCSSNLRQIGLAMMMYANENKGNFPRTFWDSNSTNVIADTTGYDSPNSFGKSGEPSPVGDNNVCASLFLTLKTQDITPEVFICPSSDGERGFTTTTPQQHSNWQKIPLNLSYSYQVPFPTQNARNAGWKWNNTLSSDFAIAADMNPGGQAVVSVQPGAALKDTRAANSPNHFADGQNILYADGHVEFQITPFAGSPRPTSTVRDNVYTYVADPAPGGRGQTSAGVAGQPADQYDSVLLPVYTGPARASPGMGVEGWICIGFGLFILISIVALVVWLVTRKKRVPVPVQGYYPPGAPGYGPPPPGQ